MRPQNLRRLVLKTVTFFLIWLLVSGQTTLYYLILGLCSAFAVAWVDLHRTAASARPFPWARFFMYLPWLFGRIVVSSIHLTRLILDPRLPIDPKLVRYETRLRDHAALTLLGNSITLTPGTVTAEISPRELIVHTIDGESSQDLTSRTLEDRVARVFQSRESPRH